MTEANAQPIERLLDIMARLREPETGCAWDLAQDFGTIAPYTIEEAYEVADAIHRGDMTGLMDELGDLLFQVVFYAQMARESGDFDFASIADGISDKMVRRHPHVFSDAEARTVDGQTRAWEEQKAEERAEMAETRGERSGALEGVALALPALMRAHKLQKRAALEGFDWPDIAPVFAKVEEELAEIRAETAENGVQGRLEDEVGDLLFAAVNLARHLNVDPEQALRRSNGKFERRFAAVEADLAADGRSPKEASSEEMDALWDRIKLQERSNKTS